MTSYESDAAGKSVPIGSRNKVIIVAAPSAVAPGRGALPFLAGTIAETEEVAAHFTDPRLLKDSEATGDALSKYSPGAELFHFSGHGWSDGGNGALILPVGPDGEPRFVTSREIARQDWRRCSLAVLSACLTAAGEAHEAVNSQSLVRALLSAGVHRVVAARWNIDSEATRVLMGKFYETLLSTPRDEPAALASAARQAEARAEWRHPYFWAGFQVFGVF